MGKIILNNIEYGIGISNDVNVDTTNLVKKDSIVTTLDDTVTDEQIPSAKAVHTAIQEARTELDSEIANIPVVTKTSDLTNDSGFITANDIPEVDLTPYALKTQIPTTLPASDVYAWAKASTKPTYTASEVGALASNGTATNASKVSNALTLQVNGVTNLTYDGSSARTFNLANASTSISGVMTPAMVTKLDGIATGATKNVVDTAMSSTSTNAVQNKVIYAYIQEQLKNVAKGAGDYVGKTMIAVQKDTSTGLITGYTYTNAKGGFADFTFYHDGTLGNNFELIVDGVTIISGAMASRILRYIKTNTYELKIPFTSTFTVKATDCESYLQGFIYVNK